LGLSFHEVTHFEKISDKGDLIFDIALLSLNFFL